jgi:transmembrane sensor
MSMADTLLLQLLDKYTTHSITDREKQELYDLLQLPENHTELETIIDNQFQSSVFELSENDELRRVIFSKIQQKIKEPAKVRKLGTWKRWSIAASLIVIIGLGAYFTFFNKQTSKPDNRRQIADISAPKTSKAVITLSDGKIIALDNITTLAQGNVIINKTSEGKLIYQPVPEHPELNIQFNTLTNPRGSKVVDIMLGDGSRIWLNAGSSIKYPVAFSGNERKVFIKGEAYFEVMPDKQHPFKVDIVGKGEVEVLGTHFNVNSYDNEDDIKITLLEGSVKASLEAGKQNPKSVILKPGEQAQLKNDISVVKNVDVELVIAWKNGKTIFKSADLKSIMRQVERWYDVDVEFNGNIPDRTFSGGVAREANLSELLRIFEVSKIHFKMEGRKLVVMP